VRRRAVQCQTVITDCLLSAVSDWGMLVVAKISPWLQLDSSVEAVRRNSEEVSAMCTVMTAVGETLIESPLCLHLILSFFIVTGCIFKQVVVHIFMIFAVSVVICLI